MTVTLIVITVCLLLEGFFSGTEIAVLNANRLLLKDKAEKKNFGAKFALSYLDHPDMLLGATLIGTNLCTVTGAMTATLFLLHNYGEAGELFAIALYWPLTLFIGEILPKTFFQANADRIAPYASILLRIFSLLLYPIVRIFTLVSNGIIFLSRNKSSLEPSITRGDMRALTQVKDQNGDIDPEEKRIIRRMIDFSSTKVGEAMVPLIDVTALDINITAGQAARIVNAHSFSRFPVYKDRVDQIAGIVDTYSLIQLQSPDDLLRSYIQKPLFVPESMSARALLAELRHKGIAMAIVVDEYGGAVGIITIEDVLEEVIGEIEDEFDPKASYFSRIGPESFIFQARTEIDFINERFDFAIPEGEYETLGGFLLEQFGKIPKHKDTFAWNDLKFTVLNPTNKNINEVQIDVLNRAEEKE